MTAVDELIRYSKVSTAAQHIHRVCRTTGVYWDKDYTRPYKIYKCRFSLFHRLFPLLGLNTEDIVVFQNVNTWEKLMPLIVLFCCSTDTEISSQRCPSYHHYCSLFHAGSWQPITWVLTLASRPCFSFGLTVSNRRFQPAWTLSEPILSYVRYS